MRGQALEAYLVPAKGQSDPKIWFKDSSKALLADLPNTLQAHPQASFQEAPNLLTLWWRDLILDLMWRMTLLPINKLNCPLIVRPMVPLEMWNIMTIPPIASPNTPLRMFPSFNSKRSPLLRSRWIISPWWPNNPNSLHNTKISPWPKACTLNPSLAKI